MNYQWYDLVGNLGVAMILVSYLLLQSSRLDARALSYSVLNAVGAIAILFSLAFSFNLSSFIIEVFWLAISLVGIVMYFYRGKSVRNNP